MECQTKHRLIEAYIGAREAVVARGFGHEIDWQCSVAFHRVAESDFLREAAWVVLNSGMMERVVRQKFGQLSSAFLGWHAAKAIAVRRNSCRRAALEVFCHERKIDAILAIASEVCRQGFERVKERISSRGVEYLETFDYIGPITRYHLAKNLGLDVVKPDRHLSRVSAALGFGEPAELCEIIANETGDRRSVVDLVIWRFATLRTDYMDYFVGRSNGNA